jgi:hypothetical protein
MFCSVVLMSRPMACAEAGIEAAFAWIAKGTTQSNIEEIMAATSKGRMEKVGERRNIAAIYGHLSVSRCEATVLSGV